MNIVNYFAERQSVKKALSDAEIALMKVCYYCKNCKKCKRFYSIKTELEENCFFTNKLNTGILEIQHLAKHIENLKLNLLEIQHSDIKESL